MTEDEAHRQAEALAQGMDITVYVVRNADGEFLPVHVVPDDCEIIATVTPPSGVQSKARTPVSHDPGQGPRDLLSAQPLRKRRGRWGEVK